MESGTATPKIVTHSEVLSLLRSSHNRQRGPEAECGHQRCNCVIGIDKDGPLCHLFPNLDRVYVNEGGERARSKKEKDVGEGEGAEDMVRVTLDSVRLLSISSDFKQFQAISRLYRSGFLHVIARAYR